MAAPLFGLNREGATRRQLAGWDKNSTFVLSLADLLDLEHLENPTID